MMMSDREQLKEVTVLYSKTVKTVVLWVGVGVEYSDHVALLDLIYMMRLF